MAGITVRCGKVQPDVFVSTPNCDVALHDSISCVLYCTKCGRSVQQPHMAAHLVFKYLDTFSEHLQRPCVFDVFNLFVNNQNRSLSALSGRFLATSTFNSMCSLPKRTHAFIIFTSLHYFSKTDLHV